MSKIIDCISYNGEKELLEIRLNILNDFVDKFIIVEFDKTFSGKDKPFYGKDMDKFLEPWKGKVECYYNTEKTYGKYKELAESSPNTLGAEHWKLEFMQKESIRDCLTDIDDEDIIMVGDTDEIPEIPKMVASPRKLKLRVYTYWLNNRSSEEFWGTLVSRYKYIKNKCLNHLRSDISSRTQEYFGYHFTSIGGYDKVKEKLTDSYTRDSYATEQVLNNLEDNIKSNRDFLNRDFTYKVDESEWPQFLKDNKEKYLHLCK